ncbi:hypothetical protein ABIB49_003765 [Arthrobacter sp. UYCu512]|uniref:hypothetical protein n=1 Tax=Arthrobacter sp. UYCu512 TaxID=3156338 RepID=UPI003391C1A4
MIGQPAPAPSGTGRTPQPTPAAHTAIHAETSHWTTLQPTAGTTGPRVPSADEQSWERSMDHHLDAIISLDTPTDTVHVDIDGSLTRVSRDALIGITGRIRQIRATSHIQVHLGRAAFVESAALAGLRTDLEAADHRPGDPPVRGRGVSLDIRPRESTGALTSRSAATPGNGHRTPLSKFTDDDLLTASDFAFAWLDDENGCPDTDVSEMLALYELIGKEMSGRGGCTFPDPPHPEAAPMTGTHRPESPTDPDGRAPSELALIRHDG